MQDHSMFSRASLLLTVLLLLVAASPAIADPPPSGDSAGALQALFSDEGGAVPALIPGWQFIACEAGPERGSCEFAHPYGGTIRIFFAAADSGHKAFAETPSFKIWFSQPGDYPKAPERLQELDSFLAAAVSAVTSRDTGLALFEAGSLAGTAQIGEALPPREKEPLSPLARALFWLIFSILPLAALSLGAAGQRECGRFANRPALNLWPCC